MTTPYDKTFFDGQSQISLNSARAVMPIVLGLIPARSIVDFGCGRGTWLKACLENDVKTVLGLDGDYVDRETMLIDPEHFRVADLQRPVRLNQRFDLAMCLEVAEHLPARSARGLVESLAAAAPVVLFSAALPGQGGTCHINEQWPPYWERLFKNQGMFKYDIVRPMIWNNREVGGPYRQNMYIFSSDRNDLWDDMDKFEPEFVFAKNGVMYHATFGWSSRALKYLPVLRKFHSLIGRFTDSPS